MFAEDSFLVQPLSAAPFSWYHAYSFMDCTFRATYLWVILGYIDALQWRKKCLGSQQFCSRGWIFTSDLNRQPPKKICGQWYTTQAGPAIIWGRSASYQIQCVALKRNLQRPSNHDEKICRYSTHILRNNITHFHFSEIACILLRLTTVQSRLINFFALCYSVLCARLGRGLVFDDEVAARGCASDTILGAHPTQFRKRIGSPRQPAILRKAEVWVEQGIKKRIERIWELDSGQKSDKGSGE